MKTLILILSLLILAACGKQKADDKKIVLVLYSTSNHYNSWNPNEFTVISKCENSTDFDGCADSVLSATDYYFDDCFIETAAIHSPNLQYFLDNCCKEVE